MYFFITLNVAVGKSWLGSPSETTPSGNDAGMELQYVAVYQSRGSSSGALSSGGLPSGEKPPAAGRPMATGDL